MESTRIIPNLFIVGAPKCGTTAMNFYLGRHPEIFMAKARGTNHFATDLIPLTAPFRSDEKYFALFEDARDHKIVGEKSAYYLLSKKAAQNIYQFNREAKIIIMLRNPVDMLPSHHAQQIYNGIEDITDFEEALNAENGRKNGEIKLRESLRIKGKLFYSEVVSFTEQVERYLSLFGEKQVHIVIYDDFKKDIADVYKKTLEFLNVESTFQPDFPVINARKTRRHSFHKKLKNIPLPFKSFIKTLVPESVQQYLFKIFKRLDFTYKKTPPLSPAVKKRLQETYKPEIQKLSVLLGRDLNYWWKDTR